MTTHLQLVPMDAIPVSVRAQLPLRPVVTFAWLDARCPMRAVIKARSPGPVCRSPRAPMRVKEIANSPRPEPLLKYNRVRVYTGAYAPRKYRQGARPKSLGNGPLSKAEKAELVEIEKELASWGVEHFSGTVASCPPDDEPCPYVFCRHHNYLEVNPENGALKLNFPHLDIDEIPETCSIREARKGEKSHELVGRVLNLTHEWIHQTEQSAFRKIRRHHPEFIDVLTERLTERLGKSES